MFDRSLQMLFDLTYRRQIENYYICSLHLISRRENSALRTVLRNHLSIPKRVSALIIKKCTHLMDTLPYWCPIFAWIEVGSELAIGASTLARLIQYHVPFQKLRHYEQRVLDFEFAGQQPPSPSGSLVLHIYARIW